MALSNTAVPIIYGEFREKVMARQIPICREIEMEMNRIEQLIADPAFYYDDEAIIGFIKFCENEMTLTDGSDLYLLDTFKLWAEALLSWYYFTERSVYEMNPDCRGGRYVRKVIKKRLVYKQFLIIPRGAAKTMYLALLQAYVLNIDKSTTKQVTIAPTMQQADEVLSPIRTAITRARGPLFKFLTEGSLQNTTGSRANRVKLASTKKGIQNFITGSILQIRPMTIDKNQGYRDRFATIDEWLSGATREDVIEAVEEGCSKLPEYQIVAASSEGTIRDGVGDTIKMELQEILRGDYPNPHVSIWYYKLDDIKEVGMPEMWRKAQPNLDFTVSYETYQEAVERAENNPAARNEILAKRFNLPMSGYTFFFTYQETRPHSQKSFWSMRCAMGADLSQGDDFCAFTFLFPLRDGRFGVKTRCYVTSRTMTRLAPAMRLKYHVFLEEGSLVVLDGIELKVEEVFEDLQQHIDKERYDVRAFGFDPYNAKEFVDMWERKYSGYHVIKVQQGARTESVPLGEIKKFAQDRVLLFDQKLMSFTMDNSIAEEDSNGNRKLCKRRYADKIDSVSALLDAYVAFKVHKENF